MFLGLDGRHIKLMGQRSCKTSVRTLVGVGFFVNYLTEIVTFYFKKGAKYLFDRDLIPQHCCFMRRQLDVHNKDLHSAFE